MKLLRYGEKGRERPAILDEQGALCDLSSVIPDLTGKVLSVEWLEKLSQLSLENLPKIDKNIRIAPCLAGVGKLVCIGRNYVDHAVEMKVQLPKEPVIFGKWTSAISGPYDEIERPLNSEKTDWEAELGVVVGRHGRYIEERDAFDHIAGYCIINDISERDFQYAHTGTWSKGKGCDSFAPIGPWFVTKDEIADPHDLHIWLEIDGHRYQDGNTKDMIFSISYLISYVSRFMSLHPGDIIATGTPSGVGRGQNPPIYLQAGQRVKLGIQGLGQQEHLVG